MWKKCCPQCLSLFTGKKCSCGFVERRKGHTMFVVEKERRGNDTSRPGWNTAVLGRKS